MIQESTGTVFVLIYVVLGLLWTSIVLLCTYFTSLWGWITWELDKCLKRHNASVSALKSRFLGVRGKRGERSQPSFMCFISSIAIENRMRGWMIQ